MQFSNILGQDHLKSHLTQSVDHGRIPHAQLFVGPEGSGTLPMAIAYAQYILCQNSDSENNGGNEHCNLQFNNFSHPDLHFVFPVATTDKIKKHPVSNHFMVEWRQFLKDQPYGNLFDWYKMLGIENKQGQIGVEEALNVVKSLSLKSYEGGYKVMIIWMAEKMNISASNKLLKLIEEPPAKTIFILIAKDEGQIINTIRSRCQMLHFSPLSEALIVTGLKNNFQVDEATALKIARQSDGNFYKASNLAHNESDDKQFEEWFVLWVRSAFKAKGNKAAILDLIGWSDQIAKTGRETQKQFLLFCMDYFRQALLMNYNVNPLVFLEAQSTNFKLANFAPFIHEANIMDITKELEDALYHIERNGNSKIILTDLSIKLTRLLHKKAS